MEDIINGFEDIKISALAKARLVNGDVNDVTIGPKKLVLRPAAEKQREKVPPSSSTDRINTGVLRTDCALPAKKVIAELEKERYEKVQEAVNSRKNLFTEFSKQQELTYKQQWLQEQQNLIATMQQQESLILKALEQHDKNTSNQHQQLVQYYQQLAEKQKKNIEELHAREKRKQFINSVIDSIKKDQLEFRTTYQEIATLLKTCGNNEVLKAIAAEYIKQLKILPESMDEIITRCRAGKISENEAKSSSEVLQSLKTLKLQLQQCLTNAALAIEQANKKEAAKQQSEVVVSSEVKQTPTDASRSTESNKVTSTSEVNVTNIASMIEKYISKSNLKKYTELQNFLDNYRQSYHSFAEDASLKQFKFELKKAVNIPVNAISAVSSQHLFDKYVRLNNLLSGKSVLVGEASINASRHPQAIAFCTDLLAEKFVLQGDLLVSSNPEAAFCYASVIVALWNDFPDFGKLLLAHFYEVCPYLVPWYVPRSAGDTNEEYYRKQGYKYVDGVPEKQDKFLKRMTGLVRLYTAIFITKPKRGHTSNPHGISEAWRWAASVLNLEPRLDITATILHVFLETVGFAMQSTYGKMFQKLIKFIQDRYLVLLAKIDSGGPVTRLIGLLDEYKMRQNFEQPKGFLPNGFW